MANTWTAVGGVPSGVSPDTMMLLSDGTVLVHNAYGKDWYRLTPDNRGRYESGSWSGALNMANTRQFFASGLLRDGRVFAIGGEYSDAGNATALGEVFDPTTNAWSALSKPASMSFINSDAVSCVLPDGRVLLGSPGGPRTAIWDPALDVWVESGLGFGAAAQTKNGNTNEESWALLPDGTVLTVEITGTRAAEKYLPATDRWVSAGATSGVLPLVSLVDPVTSGTVTIKEIGPGVALTDGRCFFVGATGRTGIYTPPAAPALQGTWAAGPSFPADTSSNTYNQVNGNLQTSIDSPGVVLPNGRVLCVAGNTVREVNNGQVQFWSNPATVYVFDPVASTMTALSPQPPSNNVDLWQARFLLLPTGQVLFSTQQGGSLSMLTVDPASASPQADWRPTISSIAPTLVQGHAHLLTGTQLTGLTQACTYGDDAGVATNYPIVRVTGTATNDVAYLRTSDFSSLAIATGSTPQTAVVHVPSDLPVGQYSLVVTANGIASDPVTVTVAAQDCFLVMNRSTYGEGEVQALVNLNGTPALVDQALYVVVEGFTPAELGLTSGNLAAPPNPPTVSTPVAGLTFEPHGSVLPQDPALPPRPQRFTFPYRAVFADTAMFGFAPTVENELVTATLSAAGATVSAAGVYQLIKNPNPFILDGDSAHGDPFYLSTDIRVFQVKAGQTRFAVHLPTSGSAKAVATSFIQQVITNLNGSPGSAGALFDALPTTEDAATLALSPTDSGGTPVYNFAVARVRYRDTVDASNVRLFFRMWPAQNTNALYDTSTLYRAATNGSGQRIPLLGAVGDEIMTIPFFAAQRVDTSAASMTGQTDTPNVRPVITADALGGEVDSYFGCWLDINQPGDKLFPARLLGPNPATRLDGPFTGAGPLLSIQEHVRSAHQCLIAEVSFDPVPIGTNQDPSTSDKLAQRNLAFVNVPNPGLVASRVAPQTFEVRATPAAFPDSLPVDEMMIEWSDLPGGSTASIYLPGTSAQTVLDLADQLYAAHRLVRLDDRTIGCPADGVTFLPIPKHPDLNLAGLLSVDLPLGITKGESYHVTVRQITAAVQQRRVRVVEGNVPASASNLETHGGSKRGEVTFDLAWRRVLGVFAVTIPVGTKGTLLEPERRLLSVLRWIGQSIPVTSRWFPVFDRYLELVAGRVRDMGGDPDAVVADPAGHWKHKPDDGKGDGKRGGKGKKGRDKRGKDRRGKDRDRDCRCAAHRHHAHACCGCGCGHGGCGHGGCGHGGCGWG